MADKPVTEIVNLDAILDALPDSPTTSDVFEATLPFPARDVAASAAQRALNGGAGGGGTPDLAAVLAEGAAAGGAAITGLADPSGDQDAATKKYVDDNAGGSFAPTDLAGLALWLDASTLALADDAAVATWPDASGNGYDATQATANLKPVCKTAVMNGLRVVRFDDSPNVQHLALSGAGLGLFRDLDACTIAVVSGNAVGNGTNYVVFASTAAGDIWNRRVGLEVHGDNVGVIAGCNDESGSDVDIAPIMWAAVSPRTTVAVVGTLDFAGKQLVIEATLPPTGVNTVQFTNAAGALPDTASQAIFIGAVTDASGGSNIDYAEIIVYQRALNGTERRQLLEYLSSKWATL